MGVTMTYKAVMRSEVCKVQIRSSCSFTITIGDKKNWRGVVTAYGVPTSCILQGLVKAFFTKKKL